jgi:ComF family protein
MAKNLLNLFFPDICLACANGLSDNERYLCTDCRHELPVTNFHFNDLEHIKRIFYGRIKLENATALLKFQKKGITQQLIHNLKYRGYQDIGTCLGAWLGHELSTTTAYKTIDVVVPVPLHKSKLRKRGYNQVTKFGVEIAKILNAEFNTQTLIKKRTAKTQVFKKRFARWSSVEEVFDIKNNTSLTGKHILLVDDIITTGATMEACANALLKIPNIKLSIASMAIA